MSVITVFLIALVVLAVVFVKMAVVIIPQSETKIVERLGKYYATLGPGINIIIQDHRDHVSWQICLLHYYRPS